MKITLLTGKTYNIEQEFDFPLKVNKSARAKKLTLRIDSKERIVVLTLPRYCSQKKALEFIKSHEDWVKTTLEKLPERRVFFNGEKIGKVTSGGVSPILGANIALAYVKNIKEICTGTIVQVMIREKLHDAEIVKRPFVPKRNRITI